MENFGIIIIYLVIGLILKRVPAFTEETGVVLNKFVIYVSLPAMVLLNIPKLEYSNDVWIPVLMPWGALLFSCCLVLGLSRVFGWNRSITGCMLLLIPLGNTSFLGIPMVKAFFGDSGIPYLVLYDQLGSFVALATYGSLIAVLYGSDEAKPTVRQVLKNIITFPPFIALIAAIIFRPFTYPVFAVSLLNSLSSTLVPLAMIAVSYQMTLRLDRELIPPLSVGLGLKLVATPMAAYLFCQLAGFDGESAQVSIFEAGMPPMVSAGALAIMANLAPVLAAALVGLGILISFVTLPLLFLLIT